MINKFSGEHAFLAAWYPAKVTYKGQQYMSIEAAWKQQALSDDSLIDLLRQKYADPQLAQSLSNTASEELSNGNNAHENDLGVCHCSKCAGLIGKNRLGKLTEQVRAEIAKQPKPVTVVWVAGSRDFTNWKLLCEKLDQITVNLHPIKVVEGGARGADNLAKRWAEMHGYERQTIEAEWELYATAGQKNPAGMIRNGQLCAIADVAVFFWNGSSPGTAHSINLAKQKKIPYRVIRY